VFDTYLALVLMRLAHIQLPSVIIGFPASWVRRTRSSRCS